MKKIITVIYAVLCLFLITSCKQEDKTEQSRTVVAMDTVFQLKAFSENDNILQLAEEEIRRIENKMNRSADTSEVYNINHNENCVVSDDIKTILNASLEISEQTNGAFDITIAPVMDLWGFYGQNFRVPADDELSEAMTGVDYHNISIIGNTVTKQAEAEIDLGGIAKGFTSDRIAELFKRNGVNSAIISLGGNVYAIGKKMDGSAWKVAIQNPENPQDYIGAVDVSNKAVVTSGGYQRCFEQDGALYHHIINPETGSSAKSGLSSVTVIAEKGTRADGLSTALFVMGLDKASEFYKQYADFEAVFITDNNDIYVTEGIKDCFSTDRQYNIIQGGLK